MPRACVPARSAGYRGTTCLCPASALSSAAPISGLPTQGSAAPLGDRGAIACYLFDAPIDAVVRPGEYRLEGTSQGRRPGPAVAGVLHRHPRGVPRTLPYVCRGGAPAGEPRSRALRAASPMRGHGDVVVHHQTVQPDCGHVVAQCPRVACRGCGLPRQFLGADQLAPVVWAASPAHQPTRLWAGPMQHASNRCRRGQVHLRYSPHHGSMFAVACPAVSRTSDALHVVLEETSEKSPPRPDAPQGRRA